MAVGRVVVLKDLMKSQQVLDVTIGIPDIDLLTIVCNYQKNW